MKTLSCLSLSGGQGKTSSALLLGRLLAHQDYRVLMVDADPQANLTFYLGLEVQPDAPTLLEVLKRPVETADGIYPLAYENLYLVPAERACTRCRSIWLPVAWEPWRCGIAWKQWQRCLTIA